MKRFLSILLMVVLTSLCVGSAEVKVLDLSALEGLEGYLFDESDNSWQYTGSYVAKEGNNKLQMAVATIGQEGYVPYTALMFACYEGDTRIMDVERIRILADDMIISVDHPKDAQQICHAFNFTNNDVEPLDALINAENITFFVYDNETSAVPCFEITLNTDEMEEVRTVLRNIKELGVLDACTDSPLGTTIYISYMK